MMPWRCSRPSWTACSAPGETTAYVLHGVGSGALRDAVRTQLREHTRYVRDHRPGERDEGGERITVVHLVR
jgi:DNA mismatch repair protein MutS2